LMKTALKRLLNPLHPCLRVPVRVSVVNLYLRNTLLTGCIANCAQNAAEICVPYISPANSPKDPLLEPGTQIVKMVFSKSLDSLLKVWRENPFTAECAKFAEIFCILCGLSGEKLDF